LVGPFSLLDIFHCVDPDSELKRSFHEDFPERLVKLQEDHWEPLLQWVRDKFDVEVRVYEGILNTKQPDATILKLGSVVADYDQFKLAGKFVYLLSSSNRG
jgi:chaperone required for assembly of F1-ATPase